MMAGPQDWGAVSVDQPQGPAAWGAMPVEAEKPVPTQQREPEQVPESFLHRVAAGYMTGLHKVEEFGVPQVAENLKGGAEQFIEGLSQTVGAEKPEPLPSWLEQISQAQPENQAKNERAWQAIMGAGNVLGGIYNMAASPLGLATGPLQEATGGPEGPFPAEATQNAIGLIAPAVAGMPAKFMRMRNGVPQIIGELPKEQDFKNAADALVVRSVPSPKINSVEPGMVEGQPFKPAIQLGDKTYAGASHIDVMDVAGQEHGTDAVGISERSDLKYGWEQDGKFFQDKAYINPWTPKNKVDPSLVEQNLRDLWQERGIHPAEAVHDAQSDTFLKQQIAPPSTTEQKTIGGSTYTYAVFGPDDSMITHKNGVPLTKTETAPVRGTPMLEGTPRSELARTGEAHIDNILESPVTQRAIDNAVVDRQYTVPYTAGGSTPLEDPTMFVDRRFPQSFTIDGVTFDPAEPFAIHENVEQHVMELLIKGGMSAQEAYRVAHFEFAEKAEGAWYRSHGIDQEKAEAAYAPYMADIQKAPDGNPPPNLYVKPYPHDNPSAAQAEPVAEPKPSAEEVAQAKAILAAQEPREGIGGTPVGAAITPPGSLPSLAAQPPRPAGSLAAKGREAVDQALGLAKNVQGLLDPMATGSKEAMVIAKDAMNSVRRIRWEHAQIDNELMNSPQLKAARDRTGETIWEQHERMWNAADEESVMQQEAKLGGPASSPHMGLGTLEPEERTYIDLLHQRAQAAWLHAVDADMVEGDGLPAYTPRMVMNVSALTDAVGPQVLNELGRNVFTRTAQMLHREYLTAEETEAAAKELVVRRMGERGASQAEIEAAEEKVKIGRSIRALPLATARLEEAVIWRQMIQSIEDTGKAAGQPAVAYGHQPPGWFTIAGSPAFSRWRPALEQDPISGKWVARTDDTGRVLMERQPIYLPNEFRGPMKSILDPGSALLDPSKPGPYGILMALKGKAMTAILNSPLIHNEVVWSKVAEAAGGREWMGFGLYWRGNKIVNGWQQTGRATELIERGLAPIGPRGPVQDITGMMEEPNMAPGRSLTAKVARFIPDLFDPARPGQTVGGAGDKVAAAIDKAGDFVHNTLLWDRVRDLQFGLADHLSDRLVAKGVDRLTADRFASHFSNIVVGSIPKEAMSGGARATANIMLFSRSFTLGNLATFKQAVAGMPAPLVAQIERDLGMAGKTPDEIEKLQSSAKWMARKKAIATIAISAGLYYVGNAVIQHAFNMIHGSSVEDEVEGYARRYRDAMNEISKDPLELRHLIGRLSPTYDNEPAKQDRAYVGQAADGTAIYARNPTGKYGEEMVGYPTMPLSMLKRKLSPFAAGLADLYQNDEFGGAFDTKRPIYDPNANDFQIGIAVAKHLVEKHLPMGQIKGAADLLNGQGDQTVNTWRLLGPSLGFTVSEGAPGGPQKGEFYAAKSQADMKFNMAWPDIKRQIQSGDVDGGRKLLEQLGKSPMEIRGLIRSAVNPSAPVHGRTLQNFYRYATPEQRQRLERATGGQGIGQ